MEQNTPLELAREFIFYTNKSVFLTGKAGTGKTTFLSSLRKSLPKRMVVVAPTGVAAINAGGVTIHSFFQLSFGPNLPGSETSQATIQRFGREKINLIKSLDLLVIDEVSMVRADLLDAIDSVLRRFKDRSKPFGGVQLLLIGDLQQLSPVVKEEEWSLLRPHYETIFFFSSHAIKELDLVRIELTHIYRQSDDTFIHILNKVRDNKLDEESLSLLNQRYQPSFVPQKGEGYITLSTHNASALKINRDHLDELAAKPVFFSAEITGDFPAYAYPTEERLELKVGAQVMFVKNDSSREKLFYNGKIGEVTGIAGGQIRVKCPGEDEEIEVEPATWSNVKYQLNPHTKEVEESIVGTFVQIPLKLAWAITIHKSQGLTFEKAIIDANLSFAHGQVYVALSRCKTLEGMILSSPVEARSIRTDHQVISFTRETANNPPNALQLSDAKYSYQKATLFELFDWDQTQRTLQQATRIFREHAAIADESLGSRLQKISNLFDTEVYAVGIRFRNKLNAMITPGGPEQNPDAQDFIKKASVYFFDKIESDLFPEVRLLNPETDNTAFKKGFAQVKEALERNLYIKMACLKASKNGFSVKEYLRTRADADIDFKSSSAKPAKSDSLKQLVNAELYAKLKTWRNTLATAHDVPEYMIVQVKTMMEIAKELPVTVDQLAAVKGIGKTKAKKFGLELVEMVRDYCKQKKIPINLEISDLQPQETKAKKAPTREVSFALFQSGKTIHEIAIERNITPNTVESHLLPYIESNELTPSEIYPSKKIETIRHFLEENPKATLTEAKGALGDGFEFSEIRATMVHLRAIQS
jgi:GTPase SAR1 family protein